jgi:PAS domain-containing protein
MMFILTLLHHEKEARAGDNQLFSSCRFGYIAEEMLGQTPALLYPELEKYQLATDLEQIRKGKVYTGQWQGRRKDGTPLPLLASVSIIKDSSEKIIGAMPPIGRYVSVKRAHPLKANHLL